VGRKDESRWTASIHSLWVRSRALVEVPRQVTRRCQITRRSAMTLWSMAMTAVFRACRSPSRGNWPSSSPLPLLGSRASGLRTRPQPRPPRTDRPRRRPRHRGDSAGQRPRHPRRPLPVSAPPAPRLAPSNFTSAPGHPSIPERSRHPKPGFPPRRRPSRSMTRSPKL
jgi:hypothetical protein